MIIVSKEEGAKWPNLGSLTELRGFYGTKQQVGQAHRSTLVKPIKSNIDNKIHGFRTWISSMQIKTLSDYSSEAMTSL